MATTKKRVYRVLFMNEGKGYEVYARHVRQGELFGFIELEELLFGEKSSIVLDPSEDKLRAEFGGVRRTQIPIHAVIRVDEVEKEGNAKIVTLSSKPEAPSTVATTLSLTRPPKKPE